MAVAAQPLAWFPLNADEWASRVALLTLEQAGALFTAVLQSWNAERRGAAPGTLPASRVALERLFGASYDAVIDVVRAEFEPVEGDPALLRSALLSELYAAQAAKHASVVERARKGGWQKGRKRGPKKAPASVPASAPSSAPTSEPVVAAIPRVLLKQTEGDPIGVSYGNPTMGGGGAPVPVGDGTGAPPPDAAVPADPVPVTLEAAMAWIESEPRVRRQIEREVDAYCDEHNEGWRDRVNGAAVRNRFVEIRVREAYASARRPRGLIPAAEFWASLNGTG